jgi:hypothetical protein
MVLGASGAEVLTTMPDWPMLHVTLDGISLARRDPRGMMPDCVKHLASPLSRQRPPPHPGCGRPLFAVAAS